MDLEPVVEPGNEAKYLIQRLFYRGAVGYSPLQTLAWMLYIVHYTV